jgi:hypothetical protein
LFLSVLDFCVKMPAFERKSKAVKAEADRRSRNQSFSAAAKIPGDPCAPRRTAARVHDGTKLTELRAAGMSLGEITKQEGRDWPNHPAAAPRSRAGTPNRILYRRADLDKL